MGKFINDNSERTLVNKYVDSYLNGISKYSKYINSVPNFVTYYSRDYVESTENSGMGTVNEIVGDESPTRYNKINNFPLYGVEDSTPELNVDGINGLGLINEGSAVIIPDTIVPRPDDLFIFSYSEDTEEAKLIYRVTDVNITAIDSNTFYQITYNSTPYDEEILEKKQISDNYELIYDNISTSQNTLVLEEDYIIAGKLEKLFNELREVYLELFYSNRLNIFAIYDKFDNTVILDPVLNEFIKDKKIFIEKGSIGYNIYPNKLFEFSRIDKRNSPYYRNSIEEISYLVQPNNKGSFLIYPEKFSILTFLNSKIDGTDSILVDRNYLFSIDEVRNNFKDIECKIQKILDLITPDIEYYITVPIVLNNIINIGNSLISGK